MNVSGEEPTGFYDYLPNLRGTIRRKRYSRKSRIGALKRGDLQAVGYSVNRAARSRHAAVKRAVRKYGRNSTIRKLNAIAVYTRRTSPTKSKTFKADMKFAQKLR